MRWLRRALAPAISKPTSLLLMTSLALLLIGHRRAAVAAAEQLASAFPSVVFLANRDASMANLPAPALEGSLILAAPRTREDRQQFLASLRLRKLEATTAWCGPIPPRPTRTGHGRLTTADADFLLRPHTGHRVQPFEYVAHALATLRCIPCPPEIDVRLLFAGVELITPHCQPSA